MKTTLQPLTVDVNRKARLPDEHFYLRPLARFFNAYRASRYLPARLSEQDTAGIVPVRFSIDAYQGSMASLDLPGSLKMD